MDTADFQKIILPALLGFFGGFLGPVLVEKWKHNKAKIKQQMIIETDLQKLREQFDTFSSSTDERVNHLDIRLKTMEMNVSHNMGILKGQLSDVPLEPPTPPHVPEEH
jgi:hypothetical protein